jgi:hypothetical protein
MEMKELDFAAWLRENNTIVMLLGFSNWIRENLNGQTLYRIEAEWSMLCPVVKMYKIMSPLMIHFGTNAD